MPRFAVDHTRFAGTVRPDASSYEDAGGRLIDRHILYLDSDLGIVISYAMNGKGQPLVSLEGRNQMQVELFMAPLRPFSGKSKQKAESAGSIKPLADPSDVKSRKFVNRRGTTTILVTFIESKTILNMHFSFEDKAKLQYSFKDKIFIPAIQKVVGEGNDLAAEKHLAALASEIDLEHPGVLSSLAYSSMVNPQ